MLRGKGHEGEVQTAHETGLQIEVDVIVIHKYLFGVIKILLKCQLKYSWTELIIANKNLNFDINMGEGDFITSVTQGYYS